MIYDFDKIVNRFNTESIKWDLVKEKYGDSDVIPMWVADMDFEVAKPISEAIRKRACHEIYGYTLKSESYYEAVINWMGKHHNWNIKREWITYTPGIVPALNYIIRTYANLGDEIIIQTPVYHPFYSSVKNNSCIIVENPLIYEKGSYKMDFEDLKKKITKRTKMLILCNPHNPVGRVWSKTELMELGQICIDNNILVISDEIHFDLIYKGNQHTVFASISEKFAQNSVICTAPSKTFNMAGLQVSNIIIPNDKLRNLYKITLENNALTEINSFAAVALEAAYNEGDEWLLQLMKYLEENLNFLMKYFEEYIPKIKVIKPEGTYLVWIDCSALNMSSAELEEFFVKSAKVGFNDGILFGLEGASFQRINIACARSVLVEALRRIERVVSAK
ncbi:pyridoxal phosphate-dependent aminotransferase [Clostridium estertheticum]|uniref:MalY/PatB family protein n=1 Tax=Clostridium estertheticum TaxID=238834 RepID=UPI0013E92E95|nr:MalY/PatB family protein [Clostridium estertheticum]MBZ9687549.1 pyridoxal phosphate-dependent aminotransferase [Clostridium estertheticum]